MVELEMLLLVEAAAEVEAMALMEEVAEVEGEVAPLLSLLALVESAAPVAADPRVAVDQLGPVQHLAHQLEHQELLRAAESVLAVQRLVEWDSAFLLQPRLQSSRPLGQQLSLCYRSRR